MNKRGRPFGTFKHLYPVSVRGVKTRMYTKWMSMISRCNYPSHPAFKYYGGRGVAVCERWMEKDGYDNFFKDMGLPPDGLTLGRIDGSKGYEPGNCRWETWKEQSENRRAVGPKRDELSLAGKARAAGLPYQVVYLRVKSMGWPEKLALSTPKMGPGQVRDGHRLGISFK